MANQSILISITEAEFDAKLSGAVSMALERALSSIKPQSPESRFYSRKETARKLGVTLPTLHVWTQEGRITAHRISGRVLYKAEDINNALQKVQTSIRAAA
jgi:excisionase family DNA binding protein